MDCFLRSYYIYTCIIQVLKTNTSQPHISLGATFKLVNTINEGFTADIFAITESNTNTTFSITIELVSGGEVNGSQNGLGRDAVLLVSAEEGIAGTDTCRLEGEG